ncbi:MAG: energy transducer TonB [Candidatus Aminicenantes bacterium]|nr:energy transducer TonB [Candidatus Aminicenantes bacterium]
MRPVGGVKVPPRIKDADPVYPKTALESRVRGVVMLAAVVAESGSVSNVILLRPSPVFAESAIIAVRQWQFEPTLAEGKPIIVTTDITLYFDLKEEPMDGFGGVVLSPEEEEELSKLPPIRLGFGPPRPKLLRSVPPVYPDRARRAEIQGVVLLEVETDLRGRIKNIIVAKSVSELDEGAIQAARQLIYEPFLYNGKPRKAIFRFTTTFFMNR